MNELFVRLLLVELHRAGFRAVYKEEIGRVMITPQQEDSISPLYIAYEDGEHFICYQEQHREIINKVSSVLSTVTIIAAAWEQAPPMTVDKFRKLAEWNGIVLAARDDGARGLHLVTWRYNSKRDSADNGNYTTSIGGALLDFVRRSGIIPTARVLDNERLAEVRAALVYRLEHDEDLSNGDKDRMLSIIEDLGEEDLGSYSPQD